MKQIVSEIGPKEWTKIADTLNRLVGGASARNGKQCRERWTNILDPSINKGKWAPQEDIILLEKQLQLGNKWSKISTYLEGRTETQTKNRFKSITKKCESEELQRMQIQDLIKKLRAMIGENFEACQFQLYKDESMSLREEDFQIEEAIVPSSKPSSMKFMKTQNRLLGFVKQEEL